jgi:Protein of unknown function (DUF1071)
METKSKFEELRGIDVSAHIEKKNGLSYLSWAWAIDQLLLKDPSATWEFHEPTKVGETFMVWVSVTAFGKTNRFPLPVMDHRNKAIPNPDAFQLNTAYMRCLAKCIATHGLGLYIYAGEDLPEEVKEERAKQTTEQELANLITAINNTSSQGELLKIWRNATLWAKNHGEHLSSLIEAKDRKKAEFEMGEAA